MAIEFEIVKDAIDRWEEPIRAGLCAMHDRGELRREADADRLALALLAAVQGGPVLTRARRDPTPLAVALHTALAHVESLRRPSLAASPTRTSSSVDVDVE